jgi:hypothetical protein
MLEGKITPPLPTTAIPGRGEHITEQQYRACVEIVHFASRLQERDLNQTGGPMLRWRPEVAAAFLSALIDHAKTCAKETGDEDGLELSPIFGDGLMGQAAANLA